MTLLLRKTLREMPRKEEDLKLQIITSRVSGRGNVLGHVCPSVRPCVCVSVCALVTEPLGLRT